MTEEVSPSRGVHGVVSVPGDNASSRRRSTSSRVSMQKTACKTIGLEAAGEQERRLRLGNLIDDLLVVRLKGVLTAAEQHLVKTLPSEKGRDLLKQVRSHLIEIARPMLEAMVEGITGAKVISLHHDISTLTGEEVVLFTLAGSPLFRETKKR